MASQKDGDRHIFRHRLREIKLEPDKSTHQIGIEILVDGVKLYKLPTIKRGSLLNWVDLILPCDVNEGSKITFQITEIHTLQDRIGRAEYEVLQVQNQDTITLVCDNKLYKLHVKFLDKESSERAYSAAFLKAQEMEKRPSLAKRAGKVGDAFKVLLALGRTMVDHRPVARARLSQYVQRHGRLLENQGQREHELDGLVETIASLIPAVESIKQFADADLLQTVSRMLSMVEDVSVFVVNYESRGTWVRTFRNTNSSSAPAQIDTFISKFERLRKEFDTKVNVQTLRAAEIERIQAKLKELNPVDLAGYDSSKRCIDGTRVQIIDDVVSWAQRSDDSPCLAWIHGLAGLGKSTIATSVCQRLDERRMLACSFFCKRDSPELRDPRRVLTTIIYGLARRWNAYGESVVSALKEDPELHFRHVQPLYDALVTKPLQLFVKSEKPKGALVIIVDALDECGDLETRRQLLVCLRNMSQSVPLLRVIVTSRPDSDIQAFFERTGTPWFAEYNVLSYDALDDVRVYMRDRLSDLTRIQGWPHGAIEQLSVQSSGLFIWARTACKFIRDGHDRCKRLEQVLSGDHVSDSTSDLDVLYTTTIEAGALDGDETNLKYVLQCLGAVIVTATRAPLPLSSLAKLMHGRISPDVLDQVLASLSSVLYVDHQQGGAVRVSHPSFMDYITTPSRSKRLCLNLDEQNTILAGCCLEKLTKELRFNICGLETSSLLNSHVPHLKERVHAAIRLDLEYSCMYWASHVVSATPDTLESFLYEFMNGRELLYWLEALSLLGKLNIALSCLLELTGYCGSKSWMQRCCTISDDMYRFVLAFYDIISTSTPHLYISALAFAPMRSGISQRMRRFFPNLLSVTQGAEDTWTPRLRTIEAIGTACMAFSLDGSRIASGHVDGNIKIWDTATGTAALGPLEGHYGLIQFVVFSPDGSRIASVAERGTLHIWETTTGDVVLKPPQGQLGGICCAAFSHDGTRLALGFEDSTIAVMNIATGRVLLGPLHGHSWPPQSIAFSHDSRRIASGSLGSTIGLWDTNTGFAVLRPQPSRLKSEERVGFSHDGQRFGSVSDDGTVRIRDPETGSLLAEIPSNIRWNSLGSIAFLPDGRCVVLGLKNDTPCILDVMTGKIIVKLTSDRRSGIFGFTTFSHDGLRAASCDLRTISVWDVSSGNYAVVEDGPLDSPNLAQIVTSTAFSPDGRQFATSSIDGAVYIWDLQTAKPALKLVQGSLGGFEWSRKTRRPVMFSCDGGRIISSFQNGVYIWDAVTGAAVSGPALSPATDIVTCMAFSSGGEHAVSGTDKGALHVWAVETGDVIFATLQAHLGEVTAVAFSHDGCRIASGSEYGDFTIWDIGTTRAVVFGHTLRHISPIATVNYISFTHDDRCLVIALENGNIGLWNAATGEAGLGILDAVVKQLSDTSVVAISADDRRIVFVGPGPDFSIHVRDITSGAAVLEPLEYDWFSQLVCIALSPDGRLALTSSLDRVLSIWDVEAYATMQPADFCTLSGTQIRIYRPQDPDPKIVTTGGQLARHVESQGWIRRPEGGLLLWLPPELREVDDSMVRITSGGIRRQVVVDMTHFVHGSSWTTVAG